MESLRSRLEERFRNHLNRKIDTYAHIILVIYRHQMEGRKLPYTNFSPNSIEFTFLTRSGYITVGEKNNTLLTEEGMRLAQELNSDENLQNSAEILKKKYILRR